MKISQRFFNLLIIYCLMSIKALAISDAEILQSLETLGDWEAAYPLAKQQAEQQDTYWAWKQVAVKYAQYDVDKQNYLKVWQLTQRINQIEIYKDFITLQPQSPLNLLAIQAIFKLVQISDDVDNYLRFMVEFPNSVEALQALLRIQEIAFSHVQRVNDPTLYDHFVVTFPNAEQTVKAIEAAYEAEKQSLKTLLKEKQHDAIERIARRLFNEARVAEKEASDSPKAARQYRLLNELDHFKETKVFTELLDREERLAYQKLMLNQQTKIKASVEQLQQAVVQAIQDQTEALNETFIEQAQRQEQKLNQLIVAHQQSLEKLNKIKRSQLVNMITRAATSTMTMATNLSKNTSMEEYSGWCNALRVSSTVGGFIPVMGNSIRFASLGGVIVCASLPGITHFFKRS